MTKPAPLTPGDGNPDRIVPLAAARGGTIIPLEAIDQVRTEAVNVLLHRPGKSAEAFVKHGSRALLAVGVVPEDVDSHELFAAFVEADDLRQPQLLGAILDRDRFPLHFYTGMLPYCRDLQSSERIARHLMSSRPAGLGLRLVTEMMAACTPLTNAHRLFGALLLSLPDTSVEAAAEIFEFYPHNDRILITLWEYFRKRKYGPTELNGFAKCLSKRSSMCAAQVFFVADYAQASTSSLIGEFEDRLRSGNVLPGRTHAILHTLAGRPEMRFEDLWELLSRFGRDVPADFLEATFSRPERRAELEKRFNS